MATDSFHQRDLDLFNAKVAEGGWAVGEGYTYSHAGTEIVCAALSRGDLLVFCASHLVMRVPTKGVRFGYGGGGGRSEIHVVGEARNVHLGLVKPVTATKETP